MGYRVWSVTALSAILLIAFALQLVSVLSVPITQSITLCTYGGIQFGVFGYCDTKTNTCSSVRIGYGDVTAVDGFSLPSNARHTLSSLLIVHAVAAGLTLILLLFTLLAHFPRFRSSSGYLLFILIFSLPCFLVSLLAFLVDILLFVPHLDWGGWIVLGSTVLIAIFGVFLCVLRRTASSRNTMEHQKLDNSELQPFGQYDNAFSGGVSYKPTTNSGDLIFANSVDGYKSLNALPLMNDPKFEKRNVVSSHYSIGTEENAPLTSHAQNRPVSEFFEPPNIHSQYNQRRTPSPSRDHIDENQSRDERYMNMNAPVEYSQPEYQIHTDHPSNQPQYTNYPEPYHDQPPLNNDLSQYGSAPNFNKANRPPSMISAIVPAGTYLSPQPQPTDHFDQYQNVHEQDLHAAGHVSTEYHPKNQSNVNSSANSAYASSNAPSHPHSLQPIPPQHRNYPNSARSGIGGQNNSAQNFNRQPTIDESREPSVPSSSSHFVDFQLSQAPQQQYPQSQLQQHYPQAQQNYPQPAISEHGGSAGGATSTPSFDQGLSNNYKMPSKTTYSSSQVSNLSNSSNYNLPSQNSQQQNQNQSYQNQNFQNQNHQNQGPSKSSKRQDILLQSNPDFQIASRPRNGRGGAGANGKKSKAFAASALNEIGGGAGPYGISGKGF